MRSDEVSISLYKRIKESEAKYHLDGTHFFLPESAIEDNITEKNIKAELGLGFWGKVKQVVSKGDLPTTVLRDAKKAFTILVYINESKSIKGLLDEGIKDSDLPLRREAENSGVLLSHDKSKRFKSLQTMNDSVVDSFLEKQWIVMAPTFDSTRNHLDIPSLCPLPFSNIEALTGSHSSVLYKGEIHYSHYRGGKGGNNNITIAIKRFLREKLFNQELKNLRILQELDHPYLIRHIATYTQEKSYCIISPFAEGGDLVNMWKSLDHIVRDDKLMLSSIEQMKHIAEALKALHEVNCRHGDLKPENIFHFTDDGDGKLVIADVGVSRTHREATEMRAAGTSTRATTRSYEAPETLSKEDEARSRKYDIWSLGCILYEYTLWLSHDYEAIESLSRARKAPHHEFYLLMKPTPVIEPIVLAAFTALREDPRCKNGTALEALMKLIQDKLLQIQVDDRCTAAELVEHLQMILDDIKSKRIPALNDVTLPPQKLRFVRADHFEIIEE
ncbi:kinase-like protein [Aaosphaeria arxii CBS 175.79]|uniref:Kinase-like protein n=1 Tax=Aaosphaeria arxii CBS 175.79 TaxID=1450172 RepID=A0A6A5XZB1_9PLEO|nr:kinase-like protein [Aaosphaeria arxii CBS 175.79]KAF2018243.1 kinase-like protein [Aaosphaeria arxii CBS 175.79]